MTNPTPEEGADPKARGEESTTAAQRSPVRLRVPVSERLPPVRRQFTPRYQRSVGESMTLLNEVMEHPLDPSYVLAAEHRGKHHRNTWGERAFLLTVAVVAGVSVTAAVLQLRAPEPAVTQARVLLAQEIQTRRAAITDGNQTNSGLRDKVAQLRSDVLKNSDPALQKQTDLDVLTSAAVAVTGPGIVLTLDDGPTGNEDDNARVQDVDLQRAVNELWAAGAEAISINNNRIGPTSAIRGAGGAILVNLVALTPPYRIEAIGATNTLQVSFGQSEFAGELAKLKTNYGIEGQLTGANALTLPAAPSSSLTTASKAKASQAAQSGGERTSDK